MKYILKLEEMGLLIFFAILYNYLFPNCYWTFLALFFVPDVSFAAYLISPKTGSIFYNILHHKGLITLIIITGFLIKNDWILKTGLIFMSHSCFDRVAGYGLKYSDSFDHTHLGRIGKSKQKN
jgi:hypothetical protein